MWTYNLLKNVIHLNGCNQEYYFDDFLQTPL